MSRHRSRPGGPRGRQAGAVQRLAVAAGAALAALLCASAPAAAQGSGPRAEACVTCHEGLEEEHLASPARTYPDDIHADRGFTCLACHGGPLATEEGSLDPASGFLASPTREEIPALCGRCHSNPAFMRQYNPSLRVDQVEEYYTSTHGQRLREAGDPDVATCVSCHPAHRIRPPSDTESSVHAANVAATCGSCHADPEVMRGHDLPTDQVDDWRSGIHGHLMVEEGDVSAPTCNDCHGNHGAAPPGVTSVRNVCGQCHSMMADHFRESGHVEIFERADLPGCATCHGNHAVERVEDADLTGRTQTVCGGCHGPDDPTGREFLAMRVLLDSLESERRRAEAILADAENRGMEVSQAVFELADVNTAITKARNAIHTFQVEPVEEEVGAGLSITEAAWRRGLEALEEHRFRRVGLAVSSIIIVTLIVGLVLKIRDLERPESAAPGSTPRNRTES